MKIEVIVKKVNLKNGAKFCKYFAKTIAGLCEMHFKKSCGLPPEEHCIINVDTKDFNFKNSFYVKDGQQMTKKEMWVSKFTVDDNSAQIVEKIDAKRQEQAEQEAIMLLQNPDIE